MVLYGPALWACHGETGKGDGPKAKQSARPVPHLDDSSTLITSSDTDLWKIVTDGLGAAMPAFKNQLDDNARWAVVAYARSLGWDSTLPATPVPTAAATQAATGRSVCITFPRKRSQDAYNEQSVAGILRDHARPASGRIRPRVSLYG